MTFEPPVRSKFLRPICPPDPGKTRRLVLEGLARYPLLSPVAAVLTDRLAPHAPDQAPRPAYSPFPRKNTLPGAARPSTWSPIFC